MDATLLHELPLARAQCAPASTALTSDSVSMLYGELDARIKSFGSGLLQLDLQRGERVAIYLDKRFETVVAAFGSSWAGCVFVPVNPLLKPEQVGYILRDCNVRLLVTSSQRLARLRDALAPCPDLRHVVIIDDDVEIEPISTARVHLWRDVCDTSPTQGHRIIESDLAAILYTSGSTGRPKGVVLSHRNMVVGAKSVAGYLENHAEDVLVAALPLSFDAGFSQLTTGFYVGARVVLHNYLLPLDLLNTLARERVTGLTAVPALYMQLTQAAWPSGIANHLRYFATTGGRMPRETLRRLRDVLPRSKAYLMYGLTEAFRATYLPPEEVDRRPDSIGKAIPGAEVLVLREDGTRCSPREPGELVQRGPLVAMGYWNDAEKTAERFRPLPENARAASGVTVPEIAVFSGDTVYQDEDGFLYFVGRRDEMIKTSGYRVSPTEVEEVLYDTKLVGEAAAFGVPHLRLGEAIVVVATPRPGERLEPQVLAAACRERLPLYMVPARIVIRESALPRNANGKIDRKTLAAEFAQLFDDV